MKKKPVVMKNWVLITNNEGGYRAPELVVEQLTGNVYGHPRFEDGHEVTTTRIEMWLPHCEIAITRNTTYQLIDPRIDS